MAIFSAGFAKISSDTETLTASKQFERPLRYAIKRRDQKVERLNSDRITKVKAIFRNNLLPPLLLLRDLVDYYRT